MPEKAMLELGTSESKKVLYPLETLKKHFIALGSSGSGKTVLCKTLIEEALLQNIPAILVDTQGDLSSLGLLYTEQEINTTEKLNKDKARLYNESVEIAIYTPTSRAGIPLCINPLQLDVQHKISYEEMTSLLNQLSGLLTQLLGYRQNSDESNSAQSMLYLILEQSFREKNPLASFQQLIGKIRQPDESLKRKLSAIHFTEKEAETLIKRLQYLTIGEKDLLFNLGIPLDIDVLIGRKMPESLTLSRKKKVRLSIIYLNTIETSEQKHFFISVLATTLYQWMLSHPSESLQLLFYIDEIAEYIPAGSSKPITKDILKLLFKQARKYGIGLLTSTQNPGDIDYKAFAQFSTWAVGRLTTKQDIRKVQDGLLAVTDKSITTSTLPKLLATLTPGEFLFFSPDASGTTFRLKTRYLLTKHKTLTEHNITPLVQDQNFSFDWKTKQLSETSFSGPKRSIEAFPCYLEEQELQQLIKKRMRLTLLLKPRETIEKQELLYYPLLKLKLKVLKKQLLGRQKEYPSVVYADANLRLYQIDEHDNFTTYNQLTPLLEKELDHDDIDILKVLSRYANVTKEDIGRKLKLSDSIIAKKLSSLEKSRLVRKKKEFYTLTFKPVPDLTTVDSPDLKLASITISQESLKITITPDQRKAIEMIVPAWFDTVLETTTMVAIPFYVVTLLDRKKVRRTLIFNAVNKKETIMF